MADPEHYVEIKNVKKMFDRFIAVNDVTLNIAKGELFALLGSSGSGKSTLLRMLAGFETPTSGQILIDGEDMAGIPPYKRHVNMMFQSYALFPHMNVKQNIAFGLKQDKLPRDLIETKAQEALKMVEMEKFGKRKVHQLSGGQKQRVALARSLVKSPKLLLLDEPMGALDKQLRVQMQLELVNILEHVGVTCVMVTHDQEEAMTMSSRIAIMSEGEIVQVGPPTEIYEFPNSQFSAEFIGSVNLFFGKVTEEEADHVFIKSDELENLIYISHGITGTPDMPVSVAVRPEKILIQREAPKEAHNWVKGIVREIVYLGNLSTYHVELKSGKIVTSTQVNLVRSAEDRIDWDEEVYLSWLPTSGVVLTS